VKLRKPPRIPPDQCADEVGDKAELMSGSERWTAREAGPDPDPARRDRQETVTVLTIWAGALSAVMGVVQAVLHLI
jgi:hypothetical protein